MDGCRIRSFVLRSGRISPAQRRSYDALLPLYGIKWESEGLFNPKDSFGNNNPLVIEIGFGMGRATAILAGQNPGINYLGIEVHKPGIGRLLWEIEKREIKNILIMEGDAFEILKKIKDDSVYAFHIFFPDPWPKKRHHKRRLITRPFTDMLASRLVTGGYIYMATDWADYGDWAVKELLDTPCLKNCYNNFALPQEWRPKTEFELKGLRKNHEVREIYFIKRMVP